MNNALRSLFPTEAEIPDSIRIPAPVHQRHLLINGELVAWDGPTHLVTSPILMRPTAASSGADGPSELTELVIGSYPLATDREAAQALAAAVEAYDAGRGAWPAMTPSERMACVEDFTQQMVARRTEIVRLLMWEIGKPLRDAEKEFDRTVAYIFDSITALKTLAEDGSHFSTRQQIIGQVARTSLGVVLCMGPFNYPLNETFTTLIPALLMGNTVLFKPPKHGTLLFEPLLEAFRNAFPKGVVNTVYGRGSAVVPGLMASGQVDVLALIGSSRVADGLKKAHPKLNRLKAVLGLDAKNAAIILPEADLDLTIKECVAGALSFNGQRCTALKILLVHESIVVPFLARLTDAVSELKIGMPWQEGVAITPLAEPGKPDYLMACLADAQSHGATIVNKEQGGGEACRSLVAPAIVYPVTKAMKLYGEEQFGPVIPVMTYRKLDEALAYVSESSFGQQVSLFGQDAGAMAYLIDRLVRQVGRVNLNTQCQRGPDSFPFTGRKDSAEGTLSIRDALLTFSIESLVATADTASNKKLLEELTTGNESAWLKGVSYAN